MEKPLKDLESAIEKLEQFVQHTEDAAVPHVLDLDLAEGALVAKESGSLDRTMDLAACLFSGRARQEQAKKRDVVEREVSLAAEVVKSSYLLIQKLNRGTVEQQTLAASAMQTVERYNAVLAKMRNSPPTWSARISRYLYEKCGLTVNISPIDIPQQASVQKRYSKSSADAATKKIASFSIPHVSKQEEEAFRVKAISLLRSYGIRFTTPAEEFLSIRTTPIQAAQEGKRVLITQVLKPFPGETIEFTGEFERGENTSIPISDSFEVLTQSEQTGFPHPSQNTGWALADCMIPACPYRMDLLPKFQALYVEKQNIAKDLLPEGNLIGQAKNLLKEKKRLFGQNRQQLFEKHRELSLAMLEEEKNPIVDRYFNHLEKLPFDYHCEVQEIILSTFIAKPFEKLLEERNLSIQTARAHFQQECKLEMDKAVLDYIHLKGSLLGSAACSIILQHLSEPFNFTPPLLSDFELKLQTTLYSQILNFHSELKSPPKDILVEAYKQLDLDIALFHADSFDDMDLPASAYVKELETYFIAQKT